MKWRIDPRSDTQIGIVLKKTQVVSWPFPVKIFHFWRLFHEPFWRLTLFNRASIFNRYQSFFYFLCSLLAQNYVRGSSDEGEYILERITGERKWRVL